MSVVELPGAVPRAGVTGAAVALDPAVRHPVRFTGATRDFVKIQARGAVLLALTLGIYRFWLATDVRRFLWVNTEVDGDSLEYTGTATELLIGFLIGVAILVPLYVVFFVAALNLGEIGSFISVLAFPVLFFLGQFAVYRARRYRLTRTVFRGIRFHQGGSALSFALRAILWWTLIILTLGLAYPFALASLERYKMKHTYYGNLRGRFEGSAPRLFLRGLPMWAVTVGPLVLSAVLLIATVDWSALAAAAAEGGGDAVRRAAQSNLRLMVLIGFSIVALAFVALMATVLFPVFQAVVLRWWIDGLRLGDVAVGSRLRIGTIYLAYLRCFGIALLFTTAVTLVAAVAAVAYYALSGGVPDKEQAEIVSAVGGLVLYVILMLGASTIYQCTVKLTLWRHAVETATLDGVAALANVRAEGLPSSAVGEGLADALNVGGF